MSNDEQEYTTVTPDQDLIRHIMNAMGELFDSLSSSGDRLNVHIAILAALENHFVHAHLMLAQNGMEKDKSIFNFDSMQKASRERFIKELGLESANETDPHKH